MVSSNKPGSGSCLLSVWSCCSWAVWIDGIAESISLATSEEMAAQLSSYTYCTDLSMSLDQRFFTIVQDQAQLSSACKDISRGVPLLGVSSSSGDCQQDLCLVERCTRSVVHWFAFLRDSTTRGWGVCMVSCAMRVSSKRRRRWRCVGKTYQRRGSNPRS